MRAVAIVSDLFWRCIAFHYELGPIPQAARFHLPSAFAIPPICFIRHFVGSVQIARTASAASSCNIAHALLLGGKCYFVSSMVSWRNSLRRSKCHCLMNLLWVHSIIWINLALGNRTSTTLSLKFLPVRRNTIFSTQAPSSQKLARLLGR